MIRFSQPDLPSTRFFRADRIFLLRRNFLLRSAYGRSSDTMPYALYVALPKKE